MYGKYRNPPSKTANGGFVQFIPNSTVSGVKAAASFIKNTKTSTLGESSSLKRFAPSTLGSAQGSSLIASKGKDLFGFSSSTDGSFWMPGMSVAAQPEFETQTDDGFCGVREQGEAPPKPMSAVVAIADMPKEVYDGYNLWREFHSRTKNRPFWHCKETGATRWEKPVMGAVQGADKVRRHCISISLHVKPKDMLLCTPLHACLFLACLFLCRFSCCVDCTAPAFNVSVNHVCA